MIHIRTLNGPPASFTQWIAINEKVIESKLKDANISGDDIWAFFRNNQKVYDDLKKVLVENQGFICCYCGKHIESDHHTLVEHLHPKSKFKNLTLTYNNLLASCKGGSQNVIHIVEKDENLIDIALKYGVDIGHIEEVYITIDEIKLFRKKYDLENLSVGDRIVIFPLSGSSEQHCDTKKGNDIIRITPLQNDCQDKFSYDLLNGEIIKTDENSSTVETLGLNSNTYLNRLRKKTIDASIVLKQQLINDFGHSKTEFNSSRISMIDNLARISPSNPVLSPFVFVTIWNLNN